MLSARKLSLSLLMILGMGCGTRSDITNEPSPDAQAGGDAVAAATELTRIEDVPTCKGGDVTLLADMAYPTVIAEAVRPALLFIHGGGWTTGSRKDFADLVKLAALRGYVAASIQYRLTEPVFPAEIEDVKCAVRWLRANAAQYGVNPNKIGVFGASAGAHLALMLGTSAGKEELEGSGGYPGVSSAVQAVVNWFGPTDLAKLYQSLKIEDRIGFDANLGGPPNTHPALYELASPILYVNASSAPTLTVHGTADALVPFEQALALTAMFEAQGAEHELMTIADGGHGFNKEQTQAAVDRSFEFLDQQLRQ